MKPNRLPPTTGPGTPSKDEASTTVALVGPERPLEPHNPLACLLAQLGPETDVDFRRVLLQGLAESKVAACLCDPEDNIRFANEASGRMGLHPPDGEPVNFVDALAADIRMGRGIALGDLSLPEFVSRAKARRKAMQGFNTFAADFQDGTWWLVNEHKLENGWILVMATDISSLKSQEFKLREDHATALKASQTDHLTAIANRRYGLERAEAALEDHRRTRLPLSLALIDIDYFKRINDLYGHETGDHVLVHFAQHLATSARAEDQVSRIGGEEFLIVMPGTVAAKARTRLGPFTYAIPPLAGGPQRDPLPFTASAGLAQAHHAESLSDLLNRADVALYQAKAKGRHRTELCPQRLLKPRCAGRVEERALDPQPGCGAS